jgi:DNA-binding NarL/FixJ family response regulator
MNPLPVASEAGRGERIAANLVVDREDPRVRVMLVDDHRLVREGLANAIVMEAGLLLVGQADSGREALELAREVFPDVVIMDVSMPGINGVETTHLLKAQLPQVRVIGLSMHSRADMAQVMIEAGAAVCLSKEEPMQALIEAIHQHAGKARGPGAATGLGET